MTPQCRFGQHDFQVGSGREHGSGDGNIHKMEISHSSVSRTGNMEQGNSRIEII